MAPVLKALTGLTLVVLICACSGSSSKPNAVASAAPSAPAELAAGGAITSIQLAKGFSDGQAVDPTTNFSPSDNVFHLVIDLGAAPEGSKLGANWYGVDAGPYKNQKLDSESYTIKSGENRVHAFLSNSKSWPKGKYKVDVMLDDKLASTLPFQVR